MFEVLPDLIIVLIKIALLIVTYSIVDEVIISRLKRRRYKITKDTTIVITGASGGIGRQIALNFAKHHKATIIVLDLVKNQ
jgi:NADPH:quinone reductase-like Zn-dependent oxidoreductase